MVGIYKIENMINGKVYIGQSWDIERRFLQHKKSCENDHLNNSFNKYGIENFSFSTVQILHGNISQSCLDSLECFWISVFDSTNRIKGYNKRNGGSKGKHSALSIKKMSEIHKGKIITDQAKIKMSQAKIGKMTGKDNYFFGKKHSELSKKKMSMEKIGEKNKWFGVGGSSHPASKTVMCIETEKVFQSGRDAAKWAGVDPSSINAVLRGKSKTCKGYHWRYA